MIKAILVDDEMHGLDTLEILLTEFCPEVKVIDRCSSAKKALESITKTKPDLVFLDIEMPVMNGFELLEFLRKNPHLAVIPTIVFTSSADRNDVTNAYLLGANSYQVKSQTLDALCAQLKLLYEYWMNCEVPDIDKAGNLIPTEGSGKLSEKIARRGG